MPETVSRLQEFASIGYHPMLNRVQKYGEITESPSETRFEKLVAIDGLQLRTRECTASCAICIWRRATRLPRLGAVRA